MSEALPARKRSVDSDALPEFDDRADMVNAVISQLQAPQEKTNVAITYANSNNSATEVQAYAKIAGGDWTFYVKLLAVLIGRNTEVTNGAPQPATVDIDLGPAKVVSRQHAAITYNLDLRCWELKILGRNGGKIDGKKVLVTGSSPDARATPLHSGAILDIGGTQMMFILPDSPPTLPKHLLNMYLETYKQLLAKRKSLGGFPQQHQLIHHQAPTIKLFQMFDRNQLLHQLQLLDTSLQNNLDEDLSKEESKDIKPPYSYATMITQAILSNPEGVMSLLEIYLWISSHYAYYKYSKTGWQNLIRHNLSLNKAFEKVPRRPNEPGKGMKWQIAELYKDDFMSKVNNGQLLKQRRGLLVLRQLQLHLATHQQLPELQKYYQKDDAFFGRPGSISGAIPGQISGAQDLKVAHNLPYVPNPTSLGPVNPMQQHPMAFINQQQHHLREVAHVQAQQALQIQQQLQYPRLFGFQPQAAQQMIYGMGQSGTQIHAPPQQLQLNIPQQSNLANIDIKNELLLPIRQLNDLSNTPKLPKVSHNLFNLPPPNGTGSAISTAPHAHSRLNLYSNNATSNVGDLLQASTLAVPPTVPTSANSDLSLGFTSPKKITQLEAFTPERGLKTGAGKLGVPGTHTNQSSPAFWNFVQFSTPNGQTPLRKDSNDMNEPTSPTLDRKQQLQQLAKSGRDEGYDKPDSSPLKAEDQLKGVKT